MSKTTCFTIISCFTLLLTSISYCAKISSDERVKLEQKYSDKGQTQMDVKCSRIHSRNTAQTAVCIAYFNNRAK